MRITLKVAANDFTNSSIDSGLLFAKYTTFFLCGEIEITCGFVIDNDETILACEDIDTVAVRAMMFIPFSKRPSISPERP